MLTRGRRARVLRDINAIRADLGKPTLAEIPVGMNPGSAWVSPGVKLSRRCSLAQAIDGGVGMDSWNVGEASGMLSPVLAHFRADYDAGKFPELYGILIEQTSTGWWSLYSSVVCVTASTPGEAITIWEGAQ